MCLVTTSLPRSEPPFIFGLEQEKSHRRIAEIYHRLRQSHVPVGLVVAADVLVLLGYLMLFFVFRQNSYGSRVVETEQNQQVIVTGLYGVIRHPMYLAILIMFVPSSIALASYRGLIPYVVLPVLLVHRIVAEERYLLDHLPGYEEYCARTRYRILPYLW